MYMYMCVLECKDDKTGCSSKLWGKVCVCVCVMNMYFVHVIMFPNTCTCTWRLLYWYFVVFWKKSSVFWCHLTMWIKNVYSDNFVLCAMSWVGVVGKYMYSRNCFCQSPLGATKRVLKAMSSVKRGSLRHAYAKSTLFFSLNSKWKAFSDPFQQLQHICRCTYWYLTSLLFKVYTKGCSKLT